MKNTVKLLSAILLITCSSYKISAAERRQGTEDLGKSNKGKEEEKEYRNEPPNPSFASASASAEPKSASSVVDEAPYSKPLFWKAKQKKADSASSNPEHQQELDVANAVLAVAEDSFSQSKFVDISSFTKEERQDIRLFALLAQIAYRVPETQRNGSTSFLSKYEDQILLDSGYKVVGDFDGQDSSVQSFLTQEEKLLPVRVVAFLKRGEHGDELIFTIRGTVPDFSHRANLFADLGIGNDFTNSTICHDISASLATKDPYANSQIKKDAENMAVAIKERIPYRAESSSQLEASTNVLKAAGNAAVKGLKDGAMVGSKGAAIGTALGFGIGSLFGGIGAAPGALLGAALFGGASGMTVGTYSAGKSLLVNGGIASIDLNGPRKALLLHLAFAKKGVETLKSRIDLKQVRSIKYVGHSLGGYLAQVLAAFDNSEQLIKGYSFNSPGVNNKTIAALESELRWRRSGRDIKETLISVSNSACPIGALGLHDGRVLRLNYSDIDPKHPQHLMMRNVHTQILDKAKELHKKQAESRAKSLATRYAALQKEHDELHGNIEGTFSGNGYLGKQKMPEGPEKEQRKKDLALKKEEISRVKSEMLQEEGVFKDADGKDLSPYERLLGGIILEEHSIRKMIRILKYMIEPNGLVSQQFLSQSSSSSEYQAEQPSSAQPLVTRIRDSAPSPVSSPAPASPVLAAPPAEGMTEAAIVPPVAAVAAPALPPTAGPSAMVVVRYQKPGDSIPTSVNVAKSEFNEFIEKLKSEGINKYEVVGQ